MDSRIVDLLFWIKRLVWNLWGYEDSKIINTLKNSNVQFRIL